MRIPRTHLAVLGSILLPACGASVLPKPVEKAPASTEARDSSSKSVAKAPPAPMPAVTAPASDATSAPPKPPANAAKATAPAAASPNRAAPSAPAAKAVQATSAATAGPLDLKSLEQRLKATNAIGVLTKLSLKNQVDDLVGRFRAFHQGQRPPTVGDLRPSFDLLLMKVLSLLQDKDVALAKDIDASREAIWAVLTDRNKLAQYS